MKINRPPFLNPDQDINLNCGLLLLTILSLGKSIRGIPLLNNDRLLIFLYLLKNPIILESVLEQVGRREIYLTNIEIFSINSISINLDPLFDRDWLKSLLMMVSSLGYIEAKYRKVDGFMYLLTSAGRGAAERLEGPYFDRIKVYLKNLELMKSEPTQNLNRLINNIFRH